MPSKKITKKRPILKASSSHPKKKRVQKKRKAVEVKIEKMNEGKTTVVSIGAPKGSLKRADKKIAKALKDADKKIKENQDIEHIELDDFDDVDLATIKKLEEKGCRIIYPNLKYNKAKYENVNEVLKYVESDGPGDGVKIVIMNFND